MCASAWGREKKARRRASDAGLSMQKVVQVYGGEWEEEEFSGWHTTTLKNKHWNWHAGAESLERPLTGWQNAQTAREAGTEF